MNETETRLSWWNVNRIGAFTGGILGFFFAMFIVLVFVDLPLGGNLALVSGGIATGTSVGYFFPYAAGAIVWVISKLV